MYAAIRAATRVPADWQTVVDAVVADLSGKLPPADEVLREVPARAGDQRARPHDLVRGRCRRRH